MTKVAIETLGKAVRGQLLKAIEEPVVVTDNGEPILVIRSLLDDDAADELIAENPEFQQSIRRAREQKAQGQTATLAEIRERYAQE